MESQSNLKQFLPTPKNNNANDRLAQKIPGLIKPEEGGVEGTGTPRLDPDHSAPSMIGKEIAQTLQKIKGKKEVIQLEYGGKTLDIRTINIQQLVKKFAQQIF